MKKVLTKLALTAILAIIAVSLSSCQKETWDFNYPKEQLCAGWWDATHYSSDGNTWTRMSTLNRHLSIRFYEDGDYSSIGMFETRGSNNYTYSAEGNRIDILMDGRKLYDFTVMSWSGTASELKMVVNGGSNSTAYFKFELD